MTKKARQSLIDFLLACAHRRVDARAAVTPCFYYECRECGGSDLNREDLHVRPTLAGVTHRPNCLVGQYRAIAENDMLTTEANTQLIAERDAMKGLMKRRAVFILGLLWNAAKKQEAIEREVAGEREARHKLEAALTGKDKAMGVLFERLTAAGVDCSDLIP